MFYCFVKKSGGDGKQLSFYFTKTKMGSVKVFPSKVRQVEFIRRTDMLLAMNMDYDEKAAN